MQADAVDRIVEQWQRERPELDASTMGVFGRLVRASKLAEADQERLFARFGLSGSEFDLLFTLRRTGPPYRLNPTALRRAAMVTSGGMTKRLDRLETLGLIRRLPDPADRRGVLVELLPAARRLADEVVEAHLENQQTLLATLSPPEQARVVAGLRLLLRALEQTEPAEPPAPATRRGRRTSRSA
ncbi:MAG TPA: MarR family transcriptional regulator [Gaiellaceae bacterium]|nr:MarR family transcriptional regulator [Gaiellaceae bacterium]